MTIIACVRNRFSVESWLRVFWVDSDAADVACDYLVYAGPDIELLFHPETMIRFRQNEFCGVLLEDNSIHTTRPEFNAPLGYPKWRDEFFVLRAGKYAVEFLAKWRANGGDVSRCVWELGVQPCMYPDAVVKLHCPLDAMPAIQWGMGR